MQRSKMGKNKTVPLWCTPFSLPVICSSPTFCKLASVENAVILLISSPIIRADLPSIQDLYRSGSGKELLKSLQTPHTLHINCSELYLQAVVTEHCSLKPAATETVSSPRLFLC
ncbi:hypothetical protein AMECASPLE_039455 [Ameca splendens]|uniref:Uncharacterized protein n=1 Tax=Ameca splendens TaxID=208324 RepID=A0ABV1A3V1_9TELE